MKSPAESTIAQHRILPVVSISDPDAAGPLAQALIDGGLPIAEITLRTDCALSAIESLANRSDFLVGAGTVLNEVQCRDAVAAGARFVVSPGFDDGVFRECFTANVPYYPGVATATEIQRVLNLGISTAKFFPAESLGGVATLKALSGPFHQMKFIPTGGINQENMNEYLQLAQTLAIGGSWMVKESLYDSGDFTQVTSAVSAAVQNR